MCRENDNVIKIVMTSDEKYILQIKVTLWSVLMSSSADYQYQVNVLCSASLKQESREKLIEIEKHFNNVKIIFVEVKDELFADAKVTSFYGLASYYRLIIPEIIDGDRCLFLDGDLIVNTDISELCYIDMEDKLLAAVLDLGVQDKLKSYEEHRTILDIPSMSSYVNVGVMVWNLKKLREMNLHKEFMQHISKGYPYMDNDILNICCYSKIHILDFKYNLFSEFFNKPDNISEENIYKEALLSVDQHVIIHYAGSIKPWNVLRSNGADLWWEIAQKALGADDYKELRRNAEQFAYNTDWSNIVERAKNSDNIIIFGYSQIGRDVCESLKKNAVTSIRGFCDNDKAKHIHTFCGYKVNSVEYYMDLYPDALWIVTSQNYHRQIIQQLKSEKVLSDKIIRFINKDFYYFRLLDEKYIKYEKVELESFNRGVRR